MAPQFVERRPAGRYARGPPNLGETEKCGQWQVQCGRPDVSGGAPVGSAMGELRHLWKGELPLGRAFWTYAVVLGVAINVLTSGMFLALMVLDQPLAALAVGYGVSVPYNIVATVGVWRAAGRYDGDPAHAELARVATLVGMMLLSLT